MVTVLGVEADTVAPRSILFLGGTGVISAAAAQRAVALGHRVTILNWSHTYDRTTAPGWACWEAGQTSTGCEPGSRLWCTATAHPSGR